PRAGTCAFTSAFVAVLCPAARRRAAHAEGVGRYQAGAVSCASFVAGFAVLAGGPWPHFIPNGWAFFAGAVLGVPVAFTAAAMVHGRRGARGGRASTLASVALGWAAAVAAVIFALAGYAVFLIVRAGYLSPRPVTWCSLSSSDGV